MKIITTVQKDDDEEEEEDDWNWAIQELAHFIWVGIELFKVPLYYLFNVP